MLGLGKSLVRDSALNSYAQKLAYAFSSRVRKDGGLVEKFSCLMSSLRDLTTGSDSLLIDRYASPAAAYSLRKLRRDYLGPAIRVRRDSFDDELDIFFNSDGSLDTASLETFCAGTDGYVSVWYDQSSNGNDATQGDEPMQPKIYYSIYENALLQSNTFSTSWSRVGTTLTVDEPGYDGSSDAWKLEATGDGLTDSAILKQPSLSVSGVSTFSVYAKAGNTNFIRINLLTSGSPNCNNYFDLSGNGAVGASPSGSVLHSSITAAGNGFYRIALTYDGSAGNITEVRIQVAEADGDAIPATNSYIYIQDAQLETGDTATDYVETTTTPSASAGYVVTENGNPALEFDGSDDYLLGANKTTIDNTAIFSVIKSDSNTQDSVFIQTSFTAGNFVTLGLGGVGSNNAIGSRLAVGGPVVSQVGDNTFTSTDQTLVSYLADNATGQMFIDGTEETDVVGSRNNFNATTIGARGDGLNNFLGKIQEVIFYDSDESTNRTGIESNINDYYSIYP